MNDQPDRNQPPRVTLGQIGLLPLLMLMLVFGVAAGIAHLLTVVHWGPTPSIRLHAQFLFILLTLAAPLVLMAVVSLIYSAVDWFSRR
jgi:hypothetical protein